MALRMPTTRVTEDCESVMGTSNKILRFQDWMYEKEIKEATNARSRTRAARLPPAYDPTIEIPPDHPYFRFDKEAIDAEIHNIVTEIQHELRRGREDEDLKHLYWEADDSKTVQLADALEIAMTGQQGIGKSLLTDALLHQQNLSKTSAEGSACTATPVKYQYRQRFSGSNNLYDGGVQFKDDFNLIELIDEHARRYTSYHHLGREEDEYSDDEQQKAEDALEFFYVASNADNQPTTKLEIDRLLTKEGIETGSLQGKLLAMAQNRIQEAGTDHQRALSWKDMDIEKLRKIMDKYVVNQEGQPALWPLVQHGSIMLDSVLTRHRVFITDLPGLGDLSHSRTAATNAVKRNAGVEIIVDRVDRVMTDVFTKQLIKSAIKAHGARNVIVVLNRIDEYFNDENSIDDVISRSEDTRIRMIKEYLAEDDAAIDRLETESDGSEEFEEKPDMKYEDLVKHKAYLKCMAQCIFVQQRAESVENKMRATYLKHHNDPIHIFSVSSTMYKAWTKTRADDRPILTPQQTGIPGLRRHLLSLNAEKDWEKYRYHISTKLPRLLDSIARIAEYDEQDNTYAIIRPAFQQSLDGFKNIMQPLFDRHFDELPHIWTSNQQKFGLWWSLSEVVRGWGDGTHWNTYDKGLREHGIVRKTQAKKYWPMGRFNWNEELSEKLQFAIECWRQNLDLRGSSFADDIVGAVQDTSEMVLECLATSSLPPRCKFVAINEWKKRQNAISLTFRALETQLKRTVHDIYLYVSTEEDTRCMIVKLNAQIYDKVQKHHRGIGRSAKQKEAMHALLMSLDSNRTTLIDRINARAKEYAMERLQPALDEFFAELFREFDMFDKHICERLPPDDPYTFLGRNIRDVMKTKLPGWVRRVEALQAVLNKIENETQGQMDSSQKNVKMRA